MNKYVSVQKLNDGTTEIRLAPVKVMGNYKTYQIFCEGDNSNQFYNSLISQEGVGCGITRQLVKAGEIISVHFRPLSKQIPVCVLTLSDCAWVNENIDNIVNQLTYQATKYEHQNQGAQELKQIEKVIKEQGYATLIQKLIIQHADELTVSEVMDIQRTLTSVKEDKKMVSRPSCFKSF